MIFWYECTLLMVLTFITKCSSFTTSDYYYRYDSIDGLSVCIFCLEEMDLILLVSFRQFLSQVVELTT